MFAVLEMADGSNDLAVLHMESATAIVVKHIGDDSFEPLYAVVRGQKTDLPPCFSLNDEAREALRYYVA